MKLKRINENVKLPTRPSNSSCYIDLYVDSIKIDADYNTIVYDTGIYIEDMLPSYCAYVYPTQDIYKANLVSSDGVGLICSDHEGSIQLRFHKVERLSRAKEIIKKGDKIARIVLHPYIAISIE